MQATRGYRFSGFCAEITSMPNVTSISKDYGYLIIYAMIRYVSSQMAYQMEENSFRGCVPEISAILLALGTFFLQRYTVWLRQIRPFGQFGQLSLIPSSGSLFILSRIDDRNRSCLETSQWRLNIANKTSEDLLGSSTACFRNHFDIEVTTQMQYTHIPNQSLDWMYVFS